MRQLGNCIQVGGLLGLLEKTGGGLHDASLKPPALFVSILFPKVLEIGHAVSTTNCVDVEIDVMPPLFVKRAKQICPDSASFRTTESLQFPDVCQEVLELFRRRSDWDAR